MADYFKSDHSQTNVDRSASPIGLVLTAIVAVAYKVALKFEGPFTEHIYEERSPRRKLE